MTPRIRSAAEGDIEACTRLLEILFSEETEFSPDPLRQQNGLRMIIARPDSGRVFVAEIEREIVGMVLLLTTVSTFQGKKVALLEDMVVEPRWRRKGIGALLLDHAIEAAALEGLGRITLLTDKCNTEAQAFYRSRGFQPSTMQVFRKTIDESC
ncbi:MAG: GCN5 family acetyltransferase [Pelodictyon luteolum]|uniref:GCN5 family acetyltransferase n=1 Tax=Pelodictyon luteolum TaxID=1100 RepID=A0A165LW63_PELLU|nr:GNAT family N-acetyltransferase [Pelodictyon luteolum]KZK74504.1 MAG: GCN5 family acetyltransferase [Pelodictyon luteolum]